MERKQLKESEAKLNYAWGLVFEDLDLRVVEGCYLISGDTEATLNLQEQVFCVGFECYNKEQIKYLQDHFKAIVRENRSAIGVEINTREPLAPTAVVKNGIILDLIDEVMSGSFSINSPEDLDDYASLHKVYLEVNGQEIWKK